MSTVWKWIEGKNAALDYYYTRISGRENDYSRLIWNFKDGDSQAIIHFAALIAEGIKNAQNYILVPIPPSSAERWEYPGTRLCHIVFETLRHNFIINGSGILRRHTSVRSSHRNPGNRVSFDEHVASICITQNITGRNILLFDDVYTRGTTSDACRHLLLNAGAHKVYAAFLGKTV